MWVCCEFSKERQCSGNFVCAVRLFEERNVLWGELKVNSTDGGIEVLGVRRSDNGGSNAFGEMPGKRSFGHGDSKALGKRGNPCDRFQIVFLRLVVFGANDHVRLGTLRAAFPARVREVPTGKGRIRHERNAVLPRNRNEVTLVLPVNEVVVVLQCGKKRQPVTLRTDLHVVELVAVHRRSSDGANLAGLDERVECLHRLLDRGFVVEAVDLVEVEVVRPKAAKRPFDFPLYCRLRQMTVVKIHLGGDNDFVPGNTARLDRVSKEFLARSVRVAVGGVEEVDAQVERMADHLRRLFLRQSPKVEILGSLSVRHTADADAADLDVRFAEFHVFHGIFLSVRYCPRRAGSWILAKRSTHFSCRKKGSFS